MTQWARVFLHRLLYSTLPSSRVHAAWARPASCCDHLLLDSRQTDKVEGWIAVACKTLIPPAGTCFIADPSAECPCCGVQVAEKEIGESDEEESEVEEVDVDLVEKARVGLP